LGAWSALRTGVAILAGLVAGFLSVGAMPLGGSADAGEPPPRRGDDRAGKRRKLKPGIYLKYWAGGMPGGARSTHVPFSWVPITLEYNYVADDDPARRRKDRTVSGRIRTEVLFGPARGSRRNLYLTEYEAPIEIPPGARRRFRAYVFADNRSASLKVQLPLQFGTETRSIRLSALDEDRDLFWVVGEVGGGAGVSRLADLKKFLALEPEYRRGGERELAYSGRDVAAGEVADLPDCWLAYDGVRGVILDGPPREALSARQLEALTGYVHAGGHLIIAAGADSRRIAKQGLDELLGLRFEGEAHTESIGALAEYYGGPLPQGEAKFAIGRALTLPGSGVEILVGMPDPDREGLLPLVTRRRVGLGTTSFVAFPFSMRDLQFWDGRHEMLRDLTGGSQRWFRQGWFRQRQQVSSFMGTRSTDFSTWWEAQWTVKTQRRRSSPPTPWGGAPSTPWGPGDESGPGEHVRFWVSQAFDRESIVKPDTPRSIALFLGFYCLLLVPLNFLIFDRLGRRELAWAVVPLLALGFAFFSYIVGWVGKEGAIGVDQVSVLHCSEGSRYARATSFLCFSSRVRRTYRITFEGPQPAIRHLELSQYGKHRIDQLSFALFSEESAAGTGWGRTVVDDLTIRSRTFRFLEGLALVDLTEYNQDADLLDGRFRGRVAWDSEQNRPLRVQVSNGTPFTLYDAVVVSGKWVASLGELPPGKDASSDGWIGPSGSSEGSELMMRRGRGLWSSRFHGKHRSKFQRKVRQILSRLALDELTSEPRTVLLGWTYTPILRPCLSRPIRVTSSLTLVIVDLPREMSTRRSRLFGDSWKWRMIRGGSCAQVRLRSGTGGQPSRVILGGRLQPSEWESRAPVQTVIVVDYSLLPGAQTSGLLRRLSVRAKLVARGDEKMEHFVGTVTVSLYNWKKGRWDELPGGPVALSRSRPTGVVNVVLAASTERPTFVLPDPTGGRGRGFTAERADEYVSAENGEVRLRFDPIEENPGPAVRGLPAVLDPDVIVEYR